MVESVLHAFQEDIIDSKVSEEFPKSFIHGDFNDANILLDGDFRVSGVIDFGDSVERYVAIVILYLFGHSSSNTRVSGLCKISSSTD